jgi:hypothetical protein
MATVLTALQPLHDFSRNETLDEPGIRPLPFDPFAVLSSRSTEDHVQILETPSESSFVPSTTLSQYLAQLPEDLKNPTVLSFVSPNRTAPEWSLAGAGSIPESSIILQRWDGVVLERGETKFGCHLYEGDEAFPLKWGEIDLEELSIDDRESVKPGAMFIWTIGYRVRHNTRTRFSEIYFRRLPRWTKEEIHSATKTGVALSEDAGWFKSS